MRRNITVIVVIVVVALAGYGALRVIRGRHAATAPQVAYATATYGNLIVNVTGSGTVQAATTLNVEPQQTGTITSVPVAVGQSVTKGQVLATVVDNGQLQTQLLSAKAQLASDESSLSTLLSPTTPTAAQIQAQTDKVQADTQRVATDNLDQQELTVTAPIGGIISQVNVAAGQTVGQGSPLYQIVDPSSADVTADFPGTNLQSMFIGEGASVTVAGFGAMNASVSSIGIQASGAGRYGATYPVTLALQSPPTGLRAGMAATASVPQSYTYAQGTIGFANSQTLTAPVSATVATVSDVVGSTVSSGATVMTLSAPSLAQQLATDEAQLATDQYTLSQMQNPTPPSATQITSDRARIAVDQQNIANDEQAISELNITSPISGIITAINAQVGESTQGAGSSSSASSSTSVSSAPFAVENPNTLQVAVPIDELSIAQVKLGQLAIVTANALPGQIFRGTVAEIAPAGVNSQGVANFNVTISIANPGKLLAGMSASVSVLVAHATHALLVPVESVTGYGSNATVQVRSGGQAVRQRVVLGLSNDVYAQIVSGIKAGTQVVTSFVSTTGTTQGGFGGPGIGGGVGRRLSGGSGGGNGGGSGGGGGN